MEIIDQHAKGIMEECKQRARDAGLRFTDDSIEYLVTNQDLLELTPKGMIPTLYDYWVHDLQIVKSKKEYELYPGNPYETVINSRPPLSFYNDNNPDWLNVMIFYHVLAHIDFMQNNSFYRHTWGDDFVGVALADKRLIADLRSRHGRWVDYIIEFTRGVDNLVGFHEELAELNIPAAKPAGKLDYFFDVFLQQVRDVETPEYLKEIDRLNEVMSRNPDNLEAEFLREVRIQHPEFETLYEKYVEDQRPRPKDIIEFVMENSPFLGKEENQWMKSVMRVVRDAALHFAPQLRTKVLNEGWASFWHEQLFLNDERIRGHETDFAKVNALVTSVPKVGFNPYAIGMRLFDFIEKQADKGRISYRYELIEDIEERRNFDLETGEGRDFIFKVRENYCDFSFINQFVTQDFVDAHKLVVVGERVNQRRMSREYYVKSKKAEDYKRMLLEHMIHPPHITVDEDATDERRLAMVHHFEGKQLVPEFIENVMMGLEYLWGGEVNLRSHLLRRSGPAPVNYTMKDRKLSRDEKA